MASKIGTKLCLVVDLIPDHCIWLSGSAGGADGKDQAPIPGYEQQFQHLKGWSGSGKICTLEDLYGHTVHNGPHELLHTIQYVHLMHSQTQFHVWKGVATIQDQLIISTPALLQHGNKTSPKCLQVTGVSLRKPMKRKQMLQLVRHYFPVQIVWEKFAYRAR